jgi:predicted nucleic acid-binding protein
MIVVDTNILVHFWLSSEQSELSDRLYQHNPKWAAPQLWKSEFRNVISLYLRKELIDLAEAYDIIEKAELQMENKTYQVNSVQVLHFISQSNCSSYDCEFVSLASNLGVHLITLDKQLLREFPEIAKRPEFIIDS